MQVVVLAGGRGTRMGPLARDIPKPMVPVAGKPILQHQLELARRYGAHEAILLTGHLGQVIEEHFGDGAAWGMPIRCHREAAPLGTAGALKEIEAWLDDDFLVFYGDTIMDLDLARLWQFHQERRALATLVVHPNSHPLDSDLLEADTSARIVAFHPKPRSAAACYRNLANAALYVLSRRLLQQVRKGPPADLGRDVFPAVLRSGGLLSAYNTCEYIADAGTVDRLRRVEADVLSGKVARLNRRHPRRAFFLDRDGVLNVERDHVTSGDQLHLLPGAAEAVRRINQSEYLAVVVTNQPGVAKGFLDEVELDRIHARLDTLLGAEHAYLDRLYYCPHHPEKGFAGERPEYKTVCTCRKPAPGMILAAAAELNVDLAGSFVIGDRTADLAAGAAAGCRTVLVRSGFGGRDGKYPCRPDFVFDDLDAAVRGLLDSPSGPDSTGEYL
jgi:D,D-heptose 1,7-bisphosphate phosphatase